MLRRIVNEKFTHVYGNSPNGKQLDVWYTLKRDMLDRAAKQGADITQLQADLDNEYGIVYEPFALEGLKNFDWDAEVAEGFDLDKYACAVLSTNHTDPGALREALTFMARVSFYILLQDVFGSAVHTVCYRDAEVLAGYLYENKWSLDHPYVQDWIAKSIAYFEHAEGFWVWAPLAAALIFCDDNGAPLIELTHAFGLSLAEVFNKL